MSRKQPVTDRSLDVVDFVPVPVAEFDLSAAGPAPSPNPLGQISLLVRQDGVPRGVLSLVDPAPDRDATEIEALARVRFPIRVTRDPEPGDVLGADTLVTVVLCTLGEDPRLPTAVKSILAQTHDAVDVVVVDNRPASGGTVELLREVTDARLRIVAEPRRGLSVARNTGLEAARGSIIAYTDDDAIADPQWISTLIRPFFEHPDVACVTGLVLPAAIDTDAQLLFEEFGAFDKGFERVVWTMRQEVSELAALGQLGDGGVLFPYSAGVYGSGNNMAFRTQWLHDHGKFDVALGAGSLTRGGEDLESYLTVMLNDGVLVYEPAALVRHFARSDMEGLRKQMFGYGSGMAAVIAKHVTAGPRSALAILGRIPAGARHLLSPASEKNESKSSSYPKDLSRQELKGYLAGTVLYVRARRDSRRRGLRELSAGGV